jgi:hypothetical protein
MSTISASTTSTTAYKVTADTTGTLVLQTGATPTTALTIDASQNVSIPKGVGGTPAFSAYLGTLQNVTTGTFTKVQLNIEEFDTNSNFDNATNYRFTPTVSGYYQINGNIAFNATLINGNSLSTIYKNGSRYKDGTLQSATSGGATLYSVVSALVYLNGSTDYVELWGLVSGTGSPSFGANSGTQSYFNGCLVRAA